MGIVSALIGRTLGQRAWSDVRRRAHWEDDPAQVPASLEDRLKPIGEIRVQEIQFMLGQMGETRLDRSAADDEGDGIQV